MNAERRIQRVRKAIEPVGHSRGDWEIICAVANRMGRRDGFQFTSAQEIWNEVRSVCDGARGMSYARLDGAGLQWPCPSEDHPGTARLHAAGFPGGASAALRCIDWRPTSEQRPPRDSHTPEDRLPAPSPMHLTSIAAAFPSEAFGPPR